jgi:hypothetical protein
MGDDLRHAIFAAVAYLLGLFGLTLAYLLLYGIEGSGDERFYVLAAGFYFVFGLVVDRVWVLCFPALHWIGYEWLWHEASTDLPVHYDQHPLETFSKAALVTAFGLFVGRTMRRAHQARVGPSG